MARIFLTMVGDVFFLSLYFAFAYGGFWLAFADGGPTGLANRLSVILSGLCFVVIGHVMFWPIWRRDAG